MPFCRGRWSWWISSSTRITAASIISRKTTTSVSLDQQHHRPNSISCTRRFFLCFGRRSNTGSTLVFAAAAAATTLLLSSSATTAAAAAAWSLSSSSFPNRRFASLSTTKRMMSSTTTTSSTSSSSTPIPSSVAAPQNSTTTSSSLKDAIVLQNTWIKQLQPETLDNLQESRAREGLDDQDKNQTKRPVFNGHYVFVEPQGLPDPELVLYNKELATQLGITDYVDTDDFTNFVSGNLVLGQTWATPYALSIMGTEYTNNCPYGTGVGYGDGRAISIGEINDLELQLKGAGTTPFHRGADGRAVLRSSIREYLASESMHFLGVKTTRALSLVKSKTETTHRPWYSNSDSNNGIFGRGRGRNNNNNKLSMDHPSLAEYNDSQKRQILQQLRRNKSDPNVMQMEPLAITCRVNRSFVRIGHIDLFARRVEKINMVAAQAVEDSLEWKELTSIIWHACYREYKSKAYDPYIENDDLAGASRVLLEQSANNIGDMVANWIRVGFAQGNFNADNCLVGGATMDYGPFGFMEEYDPLFAKWTGSGQHFGFLNQPNAGFANYGVLVRSVMPVLVADMEKNNNNDDDDVEKAAEKLEQEIMDRAATIFQNKVDEVFHIKLGFEATQDVADDIWEQLESLMRSSRVDWTLFFRELTYLVRDVPDLLKVKDGDGDDDDNKTKKYYEDLLDRLVGDDNVREGSSPFYEALPPDLRVKWVLWLQQWREALAAAASCTTEKEDSSSVVLDRMIHANPKFVLREWMLVEAYQGADKGQDAELFALYDLIQRPYEEGTDREVQRYYRRAPDEALMAGGTAFMS